MRRLVLFDIDGTLLTTNGAAKRAFRRALEETYGTTGPIDAYDFAGKTDPQIARDLLRSAGLDDAGIDARADALWGRYVARLRRILSAPEQETTLMPGVEAVLDALEDQAERAACGLLTGNIRRGARLKLHAVGLADRFRVGAYGSDGERRDELPAVAVARAKQELGVRFRGPDVVVIGDTPHDITCGRALGVCAIGVATGGYDRAALAAAGADAVLSDLGATERVLELVLEG